MKNFKIGQRWQCRDPKFTGIVTEIRELDATGRVDIFNDVMSFVCNVGIDASTGVIPLDLISNYQPTQRVADIEYCQEDDILISFVEDQEYFCEVIGRVGNVFFTSLLDIEAAENYEGICTTSLKELKRRNAKLYLREEKPSFITLSKQEIADKFECDINKLKIED